MTLGEQKLWSQLREFKRWYGIHFRRQAPVGSYIVDFVTHDRRLVVEVDGEHHLTEEGRARDAGRDNWLASQGYRVLRINTGELSEAFDGCIVAILDELGLMNETASDGAAMKPTPTANPSSQVADGQVGAR